MLCTFCGIDGRLVGGPLHGTWTPFVGMLSASGTFVMSSSWMCPGAPSVYWMPLPGVEFISGSSHLHSMAGGRLVLLTVALVGTICARAVPPMLKVATSAIAVSTPSTKSPL